MEFHKFILRTATFQNICGKLLLFDNTNKIYTLQRFIQILVNYLRWGFLQKLLKGLQSEMSHVNVLYSFQGYSDIRESTLL